jgi:uncharacterized protein
MKLNAAKTEAIKAYFRTQPVLKAYLFGSYAKGQADGQSDIDILVELDYSKSIGLTFIQMQLDLERILQAKADLVSTNGISKFIKPLIDHEKQLLYAR